MLNNKKSVIFGIKGEKLTQDEIDFFAKFKPFGIILFARNCKTKEQIKQLTASLRQFINDDILIFIDQEGGRVTRIKPPHFRELPPAKFFGDFASIDINQSCRATYLHYLLIALELRELGINVNCAPVADILFDYSHNIIGDRAFSNNPNLVASFCLAASKGLIDGGVVPIIKHIPGHGRATVDSHEDLPIVSASIKELQDTDFIPFIELNDVPLAMTAHIIYESIDMLNPATLSPSLINAIRQYIGFKAIIVTDDINMKALTGDLKSIVKGAIHAGCDLVMHCNGDLIEMKEVASIIKSVNDNIKDNMLKITSICQNFTNKKNKKLEIENELKNILKQLTYAASR